MLGLVGIGLIAAPAGIVWFLIGVALLVSVFAFVRDAAAAAVDRPSLILTGTPKWDGVRRTSWSLEADDPVAVARSLTEQLDGELGASLTALDEGTDYRGTTRNEAFGSTTAAALVAWGVDKKPRLAATGEVEGVWLRLDRESEGAAATVTVLANPGRAVEALKRAAWQT